MSHLPTLTALMGVALLSACTLPSSSPAASAAASRTVPTPAAAPGIPLATLTGAEWVVEDIDGAGVIDNSRATLNFAQDGRLYGRSSCNNYSGHYQVAGNGINVSQLAGTRMACAASLMQQEQRFTAALTQAQRFAFDGDGALLLFTGEQRRILARRPSAVASTK